MIIRQSVFVSFHLLKYSDIEIFRIFMSLSPKKGFPSAGSYSRWMISAVGSVRKEFQIRIPRVRKSHGGPTSSIFPDILIPFGSYTIRFVLTVLSLFFKRSCSVREFCARFQISVSTLYDWIHLLEAHWASWDTSLRSIRKLCSDHLSALHSIPAFPTLFHDLFGFSFLQSRYRDHSRLLLLSSSAALP